MIKRVFFLCLICCFSLSSHVQAEELVSQEIRYPVGINTLYPSDFDVLSALTQGFLKTAERQTQALDAGIPKAIIVPHYGLYSSGPVTATAFNTLKQLKPFVTRVVLIGKSEARNKYGISLSDSKYWQMPARQFEVDTAFVKKLAKIQGIDFDKESHEVTTALELQLPFVAEVFNKDVKIVPVLIEEASLEQIKDLIDAVWGGPETVVIFTTNFSSNKSAEVVEKRDAWTTKLLLKKEYKPLKNYQLSSRVLIAALLAYAQENSLGIKELDLRTSSQTLALTNQTIGFGSFGIYEQEKNKTEFKERFEDLLVETRENLLRIGAQSIMTGFEKGRPLIVSKWLYPEEFQEKGATFVNIYYQGVLRGSSGSTKPVRSILDDISYNAYHAAFSDFRFIPLTKEEFKDAELSISFLTPAEKLDFENEEELLAQLRPKKDGLVLKERSNIDLFLPQIWGTFSTPEEFLSRLKQKIGLPANYWSPTLKAYRFEIIDLKSKDLENPKSIWLPR